MWIHSVEKQNSHLFVGCVERTNSLIQFKSTRRLTRHLPSGLHVRDCTLSADGVVLCRVPDSLCESLVRPTLSDLSDLPDLLCG